MARTTDRLLRSTEDRRREVIDAVSALIADHGIEGTSMRQLAEAAGLSTGTINHYFRNKRGLVIAAMDAVYALPADWDRYRDLPAPDQLRRMVDTFVLDAPRRRQWWKFWLEYMAHAGRDPELRARHEERYTRQRRFYARLVRAGIEAGHLRADLDPEQVADAFLGLANGLAVNQVVAGHVVTPERARALLHAYIDGLTPSTGSTDRVAHN
jgi:AcrR family transcriptional regulator